MDDPNGAHSMPNTGEVVGDKIHLTKIHEEDLALIDEVLGQGFLDYIREKRLLIYENVDRTRARRDYIKMFVIEYKAIDGDPRYDRAVIVYLNLKDSTLQLSFCYMDTFIKYGAADFKEVRDDMDSSIDFFGFLRGLVSSLKKDTVVYYAPSNEKRDYIWGILAKRLARQGISLVKKPVLIITEEDFK